jgi:formiminotetrahydrofolate cyclodeaminase
MYKEIVYTNISNINNKKRDNIGRIIYVCRGINISMNKNNKYKYKKKTNKVLTKRQKLEKKFRNVKREYLRCSRMLFHCRNDLKNMINPELIRQKKEKIARLEIQVEKLRKKGTELLDQIDEIKQQKS